MGARQLSPGKNACFGIAILSGALSLSAATPASSQQTIRIGELRHRRYGHARTGFIATTAIAAW
jgi:hypothetical protein